MSQARTTAPARRPANRRDLILDAAASLFTSRGFANVSMSDIANLVDVRPSALYRHFAGKDDLLTATVDQALDRLDRAVSGDTDEDGSREEIIRRIAELSIEHREAALLWEREARHVPSAADLVATRLADLRDAFARAVWPPGELTLPHRLSARMALAILLSPAFHRGDFGGSFHQRVLLEAAEAVLDAVVVGDPSLTEPVEVAERAPALTRGTKREQILQAAVRIFAEQTYASAGMEQIAAAVGMTASSLYNHFGSKAEILEIALQRGNGYLQVTLDDVLNDAADEPSALQALVAVYTSFALRHPGLVDALVTEIGSLGDAAELLLQAQREYVGEWVRFYQASRPQLTSNDALLVVQGVLAAINEITRDPSLRAASGAERLVTSLARAVFRHEQ